MARELGTGSVAAVPPPGSRSTRPRLDDRGKSQDIDHAFGLGVTFTEVEVASADGVSDHHPVLVAITA